ncbi:DNA repair protein RadC [Patescibacteria group bacterium]|nr:DNA repair protein RadC [Patescibacteria group bacterium]
MSLKPREKLEKFGPKALSNSDLIATILGHGTKKENVFDLSRRILSDYGKTPLVHLQSIEECQKLFDIGKVQAIKLISCFEIGRRFFQTDKKQVSIMNARDVFKRLQHMTKLNREYMYGLYLNTRNIVVNEEILSIGTLEGAAVHARDVFYPAIQHHAYTVILVHNHPSGDPNPSQADIYLTQEIQKAAKILRISLLDHVIVSKNGYFSFSEMSKSINVL